MSRNHTRTTLIYCGKLPRDKCLIAIPPKLYNLLISKLIRMGKFTTKFTEEQEKAILSLYVTHVNENIFFVKDTLPPEQWATLGAAYSRTHEPFQSRLLKAIEEEEIDTSVLDNVSKNSQTPSNEKLAEKAKKFIQKWAQEYGHNSIKELGTVRFCIENIPDITLTKIAAHPLLHLQVKSSRYLDWKDCLPKIELNEDIKNSNYGEEILEIIKKMSDGYNEMTELTSKCVIDSQINHQFLSEHLKGVPLGEIKKIKEKFNQSARKTVFDSTRYLLTPAMPTSLAASVDTRALEEIITDLLSSPLLEDQRVGKELLEKGKSIEPVLLGDKCHAEKNEYIIQTQENLENFSKKIQPSKKSINCRVFCIPGNVKMFSELQLASNILFEHSSLSFMQIYNYLKKNKNCVEEVIRLSLKHRKNHDPLMKEISHGGFMAEFLMDYGGYRDIHRHRRGMKTLQKLTIAHGFETPDLIYAAGLKDKYKDLMNVPVALFEKVHKENPHIAQLIVPFGYRCRSLFSWSIGQWIYFTELRSKEAGNMSYREIAWDIERILKKKVPNVASYLWTDKKVYPPDLVNMPEARRWYNENVKYEEDC